MKLCKVREYSLPLFTGILIAMIMVNVNSDFYYEVIYKPLIAGTNMTLHFFVNECFMVLFFGMASAELVRSFREGGDLYPVKKAINPLIATLGGILGPIVIFFALNTLMGEDAYIKGWGMCTATDIALAWLLAKIIFGKKHPAVKFLLLLAIADDGIGLLIIALFYQDPNESVEPLWLLLILVAVGIANLFKGAKVQNCWAYIMIPGMIAWLAMTKSHLHPVLSLVFIVPFIPHVHYDEDVEKVGYAKTFSDSHLPTVKAERKKEEEHYKYGKKKRKHHKKQKPTGLERFEKAVAPIVDYGLFFFGFTNAGVEINQIGSLSFIILISLVAGKTVGITGFTFLADKMGFKKPRGMKTKDVFIIGIIGSLGLTVALFVADVGFNDLKLRGLAKMGALLSSGVFIVAPILARIFKIKKH